MGREILGDDHTGIDFERLDEYCNIPDCHTGTDI